jgi:hypothetical protein
MEHFKLVFGIWYLAFGIWYLEFALLALELINGQYKDDQQHQ